MSNDRSSKLARWLGSVLTVLMLVTMLFCYLWFQVAVEIIRTKEDAFITNAVTIEAIAATLVAFMILLPLSLLWHLGDILEPSRRGISYGQTLLTHRCFIISLVFLISAMGYSEAGFMERFACDHCGYSTTILEKSIGIVSLFLCPILCLCKIMFSAHSRMRLRALA